jgi:hypothetical protein
VVHVKEHHLNQKLPAYFLFYQGFWQNFGRFLWLFGQPTLKQRKNNEIWQTRGRRLKVLFSKAFMSVF